MKRRASAVWTGKITSGQGTVSTASGILDQTRYSFQTRFENDDNGTNPEELIGAAHAGCYSMALSKILGDEGLEPESIETSATVHLERADGGGFAIPRIDLAVKARVGGADEATFARCAEMAKEGCPVSKLFDAEITLDAKLET